MAAGTVAAAVVATVLIVNNQNGGHHDTVPTANEVALQAPQDSGPDPFTPSVESQPVTAPAPPRPTAQGGATSSAVLHSVQGGSAGLYAGTMARPSCDTERLIAMVSAGDAGRAWASAAGIAQADIPGYLRSLTSAYLRVDTRVTNHNYKSGAVVEYQSVLQAGTAVLVDAQGVPRVRCACGNPLKQPVLVSDARYTGRAWAGFQPTTLIVVVPAPQPVTEIILVNVETGGWFSRLTGRTEIVDRHVDAPRGPLTPGVPPPAPWKPGTPTASGPTSASGGTSSGSTTSGATSSGATSSGATTSGSTTSGATTSGSTSSGATSSGATTSGATSSSGGPSSTTASPTTRSATPAETTAASATASTSSATVTTRAATTGTTTSQGGTTTAAGTTTAHTPAATCATTAPSSLPPCVSASAATP
ncbi:DUF6777 domain-containing protein [Kitasatospora sp. NPDC101183]|uniref:DUF6777 domain-containing protein n=1 Tax=Kitasatospora sp. NPDC101183 TaxID=3364100 RepID=UPI0038254997